MKRINLKTYSVLFAGLIQSSTAAIITFDADTDNDFLTADNWSGGALPLVTDEIKIKDGLTATLAGSFTGHEGAAVTGRYTRVGANGSAGTFTITTTGVYERTIGVLEVGAGTNVNNIGIVNLDGSLTVKGTGTEVILGNGSTSHGTINVSDTGTLSPIKKIIINNGKLSLTPNATFTGSKDLIEVGDNGIYAVQTLGATNSVHAAGDATTPLVLGSTSTLHMELGGAFSLGDTWTLFTELDTMTGAFGSVLDPNDAGHQFTVYYGSGLAAADEVVVELTAIPEPSSAALLGLGGLALLLRRRK